MGCTGTIAVSDPGENSQNPGSGAAPGSGGSTGAAPGAGGSSTGATGGDAMLPTGAGGTDAAGGTAPVDAGGTAGMTTENPTGDPILPHEPVLPRAYLRKVKGLLTGLPPTEEEAVAVESAPDAAQALKGLIDVWTSPEHPEFYEFYKAKLLVFFTNAFQQKGFVPTEDFKLQLLENGGFDLGGRGAYADDAFAKLVLNLEESFARTAVHIMEEGRPFTDVLTTREHMMTTALMSLYLQIENAPDTPRSRNNDMKLPWSLDLTRADGLQDPATPGVDIPLEESLDPASPRFMVFDDSPPAVQGFGTIDPACVLDLKAMEGTSLLFQRLFGHVADSPVGADVQCDAHGALPYFTATDLGDWRPVMITDPGATEHIEVYDLPKLRQATILGLAMPRVGFATTPAYLALWNTNDSNQHRVTANQALLVSLGLALTSESEVVPVSTVGLDAEHSPDSNPECYGCHKILDPMRQFWASYFDYNDRNDFPAGNRFNGGGGNARPATPGGVLAFADVNQAGVTMEDLGTFLGSVKDTRPDVADTTLQTLNRFALSFAQKLCYYADSAACVETDPEFRRVAYEFQQSNYDFRVLVRELFASPLVTAATPTATFTERNVVVSVVRRDQLCEQLSNRLGKPDLCALHTALPFSNGFGGGQQNTAIDAQRAMLRLSGSLPSDGFSRGSEVPVASAEPTLFYQAASELMCESLAPQVVDVTNSPFVSSNVDASLDFMVQMMMGYTTGDPHYAPALAILRDHYDQALSGRTATQAMQSTFALACQSPTSLSFGL
jgi:hypothetical protein